MKGQGTRRFRLLPVVVAAGIPLLVLKGMAIAHEAQAQEPQTGTAFVSSDDGLSPSDPARDDTVSTSASEMDVLSSLSKRRTQLDSQEAEVEQKQTLLSATEKRVDDKIAALKALQSQIQQLLGQRDQDQEKQMAALVKTYSSMKPKDAARIFNSLDDEVLIPVAHAMKPDALAPVLSAMEPEQARKLTIKLADRLTLPESVTAPVAAPATGTQAPAPISATSTPATPLPAAAVSMPNLAPAPIAPPSASAQTANATAPQAATAATAPASAPKAAPSGQAAHGG
jgi:flagellar motility protein MotE (MotC chaperone)